LLTNSCNQVFISTLDTQYTCVFVGLKKGVEGTLNTVSEVIQKVKDAVLQQFGEQFVPKAYFVSSELRSQVLS